MPIQDSKNVDSGCLFFIIMIAFTIFTVYNASREVIEMANKAMNLKIDEALILEMKAVAAIYRMSVTDLVKAAVNEYLAELKSDPFYRLTANVQEASAEESAEILSEIESLTDDDLSIVSVKRFNA